MTFGFGHVLSLGVLENRMAQSGIVFIQCSAGLVVVLACHTAPLPVNHGNILNCHYSRHSCQSKLVFYKRLTFSSLQLLLKLIQIICTYQEVRQSWVLSFGA